MPGFYHRKVPSGRIKEAQDVLTTLQAITRDHYVPRAVKARDVHLVFLQIDPKWDAFRGDARFQGELKQGRLE